ncbi:hypothetical protein NP024_17750 [Salmonella enterica]|nr:hypothetical protein [Salmonella enterica]
MIKVITLLLFALLTGCQSVESKIEELPTVGFDPILYNKSEAFTDGKVVIPPFLGALKSRGHAACAKRCFGV